MKRPALAVLGVLSIAFGCSSTADNVTPVTTPKAAVSKAREAWASIHEKGSLQSAYSRENTAKLEPYTATLKDGMWLVCGTIPPGYKGEVLETTVRQSDGNVSVTVIQIK